LPLQLHVPEVRLQASGTLNVCPCSVFTEPGAAFFSVAIANATSRNKPATHFQRVFMLLFLSEADSFA